ncbi:hypothetical protein B0G69_7330 [Paraburkholderia sp. RAU2J]|uniref:hypothetical protein n=1 Tax=Paraburkholderia sp. RAU2J TaxID=1938810 RepID=UPI000F12198F|nr:hypothetical protein [Paraburkholderia sp. RAU2J]RKT14102.1 hypothetical protein B0G69_7330 [Paraburkholderia sp. RAU2J]
MAGRHPLIAFLAGLPQFDAIALTDSVLELRSGCVVSASRSAAGDAGSRFRLNLAWPGGSGSAAPTHAVDAYKYIALQVQEAARLASADSIRPGALRHIGLARCIHRQTPRR